MRKLKRKVASGKRRPATQTIAKLISRRGEPLDRLLTEGKWVHGCIQSQRMQEPKENLWMLLCQCTFSLSPQAIRGELREFSSLHH